MGNADADEDRGGTGCGNRLASAVAAALEQKATKNSSHDTARPIMVWLGLFRRSQPPLLSVVLLMDDVRNVSCTSRTHDSERFNHETPGKARKLKTRSPGVVVRTGCLFAIPGPVSSSVGLPYSPERNGGNGWLQSRSMVTAVEDHPASLHNNNNNNAGGVRIRKAKSAFFVCLVCHKRSRWIKSTLACQECQENAHLRCVNPEDGGMNWLCGTFCLDVLLGLLLTVHVSAARLLKNQQGEPSSSLASRRHHHLTLLFLHAYYQTDASASGPTEGSEGVLPRRV
jgi:hypothetical protein